MLKIKILSNATVESIALDQILSNNLKRRISPCSFGLLSHCLLLPLHKLEKSCTFSVVAEIRRGTIYKIRKIYYTAKELQIVEITLLTVSNKACFSKVLSSAVICKLVKKTRNYNIRRKSLSDLVHGSKCICYPSRTKETHCNVNCNHTARHFIHCKRMK